MKKVKTIALGLIFTLCFSSCALMFNGTKKRVTIQSMTPKAKIYIDGEYAGEEVVTQKLKRKEDHTIIIKKEGCKTKTLNLDSEIQVGWIVFDALLNWFAFITDAPTGAWNSFEKSKYVIELECDNNSDTPNTSAQ